MKSIKINGRAIGPDHLPYLVAELSANHNGSIDRAKNLITQAAKSGADAIKLQTYTADTMTIESELPDFQIEGGLWDGMSLYQLYEQAHTPFDWHKPLFDHARSEGITCFSTPFDESAVDLLEDLNAPAYKIASFELLDLPLISYVASTKKPMIMSTGMASAVEILEAVNAAKEAGCHELLLLHCISGYPTPSDQYHVKTIQRIQKEFNTLVGLSDHSLGNTVACTAVALGGCFIEKHFILSRKEKGPDSEFSIEPDELEALRLDVDATWNSLGNASFERSSLESGNKKFRRSLYWVADANKGDVITEEMFRKIRPGFGLPPKYYEEIIGCRLNQSVKKGTPVARQDIEGEI